LLFDERRGEGLQQGFLIGETLNPACVGKPLRVIRLAIGDASNSSSCAI
jgi:hypothetical protein